MPNPNARRGPRRFKRWLETGIDLVFPQRCAGCGNIGKVWCRQCEGQRRDPVDTGCRTCHIPLPAGADCLICRNEALPLQVRAAAGYHPPLSNAIIQLKYRPSRALSRTMAGWLANLVERMGWSSDLIVPVPLSRERQRQRGYNQTSLIASELAEILKLPFSEKALWRTRETRSQVGLDLNAREANVSGAFLASRDLVEEQRVILVDDLLTTGATMIACAEALAEAQVNQVYGISVGRA